MEEISEIMEGSEEFAENVDKGIPVVALRGLTVLPGMMVHFDVNRTITIKAIEDAMLNDQMVLVVTQKDDMVEVPERGDLYEVGTLATVKQIIKLSNKIIRVMLSVMQRAIITEIDNEGPFLTGKMELVNDQSVEGLEKNEVEAMSRGIKELFESYVLVNERVGGAAAQIIANENDLERLMDEITINMPIDAKDKQVILEELNLTERYDKLSKKLSSETEIMMLKKDFRDKVKAQVDKSQKEYMLREQLKVIQTELGENNTFDEAEQFLKRMKKVKAPKKVKDKIRSEVKRFKVISSNSSESAVIRGYVETLLGLPWERKSKENADIANAKKVLEAHHYGMEKVKERILEFLAVRKLTGKGESPIICLVGPPGTGKTSIAKSVAEALGLKYARICLGGVRDEAEIRGHRRTYVGAMPGRLITALKTVQVKNPLILLDEVDKMSSDHKGDTASALLEVLDSEQNKRFVDHYIEVPVDLSEVLFLCTANSVQTIPRPLLDRMELIEVSSYTENEKLHIAKEHLLKKQREKNGLTGKQLSISPKALNKIIVGYTREAGVRNLERKIGEICRKAAKEIVEKGKTSVRVSERNLTDYLGNAKYTVDMANKRDEVGIVRGLAWTSVGGDTLQIEVNVMPGKGKCELTGQMGDVMKESAKAGISYIRSISERYGVAAEFFEKNDIHIHIPEGAVPKDGPSAGITMATAILSAITGKRVRADVAMTGEITLRGRVLPVGGLKEKILAAKNAKITTVLLPKENKRNIEEIEEEITEGIQIHFVDSMDEVVGRAFAAAGN